MATISSLDAAGLRWEALPSARQQTQVTWTQLHVWPSRDATAFSRTLGMHQKLIRTPDAYQAYDASDALSPAAQVVKAETTASVLKTVYAETSRQKTTGGKRGGADADAETSPRLQKAPRCLL